MEFYEKEGRRLILSGHENWGAYNSESGDVQVGQDNISRESKLFESPPQGEEWYYYDLPEESDDFHSQLVNAGWKGPLRKCDKCHTICKVEDMTLQMVSLSGQWFCQACMSGQSKKRIRQVRDALNKCASPKKIEEIAQILNV